MTHSLKRLSLSAFLLVNHLSFITHQSSPYLGWYRTQDQFIAAPYLFLVEKVRHGVGLA